MLLERVLVHEMLGAHGTAELASTCRGVVTAGEGASGVHRGTVLVHGLLCVEGDLAYAAKGWFEDSVASPASRSGGLVHRGTVLIHGLLSVEKDVAYAARGWFEDTVASPARRSGGLVHRGTVLVHGLLSIEHHVTYAAGGGFKNGLGLAASQRRLVDGGGVLLERDHRVEFAGAKAAIQERRWHDN